MNGTPSNHWLLGVLVDYLVIKYTQRGERMKHTLTWGRPQEAKYSVTGRMYFTYKGKRLYASDFVRLASTWETNTTPPQDVVYKDCRPVAYMYLNVWSCYYLIPISQDGVHFILCLCTWSDL